VKEESTWSARSVARTNDVDADEATILLVVDLPDLDSVGHAGQLALNAPARIGSRPARRGLRGVLLAEVPGEEPQRAVYFE
jgi:hypothetical protein